MSKPYVLGIDIGGTNTVFGIVDARGLVVASSSIKTQKHNNIDDYIDELYTEATRLIDANDATDKIHGIGIGAPNANYFTGVIEDGVNLPWPTPIPLAKLVSEKFGIPLAITNDANAAAMDVVVSPCTSTISGFSDFKTSPMPISTFDVTSYRFCPLCIILRSKSGVISKSCNT